MLQEVHLKLMGAAAISGGIAALASSSLIPAVIRLASRLGAIDHPGGRRHQRYSVPRLGGIAVTGGIALGAGVVLAGGTWEPGLMASLGETVGIPVAPLLIATLLIFVLGLVDDVLGTPVWLKLPVEIVAAWMLVQVGWGFDVIRLPFFGELDLGVSGSLLSIVWIVGVTNAINLIDGLDGLAGGVVGIIAASFLAYCLTLPGNNYLTVVLLGAIVGACSGFLLHNWAPARIFMGDCGSLTLGFLLAAVSVQSATKASAAVAILVPILALGVPVQDTLMVMAVRFLERPHSGLGTRFLRMFRADRKHLHHLMLRFGLSGPKIVGMIYLLVFSFCLFALLVAATRRPELGLALILVELAVVVVVRRLGMAREAQSLSQHKREQVQEDLLA